MIPRTALRDLYDEYVFLLDEGAHDAWLDLFTADASYVVTSRENWDRALPLATMRCDSRAMLADRLETIRSTQFYAPRTMRHFVSAVRPGDGVVTANFLVTEALGDEPARVHSAGQYRDEVESHGDRLQFARKVAIYDAPLVLTSLIYPL